MAIFALTAGQKATRDSTRQLKYRRDKQELDILPDVDSLTSGKPWIAAWRGRRARSALAMGPPASQRDPTPALTHFHPAATAKLGRTVAFGVLGGLDGIDYVRTPLKRGHK